MGDSPPTAPQDISIDWVHVRTLMRERIGAQLGMCDPGVLDDLTQEGVIQFLRLVRREATRNLELLQNQLIPKQLQSLEVARSGYVSGQIDFFNLTDAQQSFLRFSLDEVEARTQRELALVELSLIVQGLPTSGTPMASSKVRGMGAAVSSMGSTGGMLPGGSAAPKKAESGQMK